MIVDLIFLNKREGGGTLAVKDINKFKLAGFSVVGLADINPGTQLVYIVAMYISVYPVAISMRNSNVYQVNLIRY